MGSHPQQVNHGNGKAGVYSNQQTPGKISQEELLKEMISNQQTQQQQGNSENLNQLNAYKQQLLLNQQLNLTNNNKGNQQQQQQLLINQQLQQNLNNMMNGTSIQDQKPPVNLQQLHQQQAPPQQVPQPQAQPPAPIQGQQVLPPPAMPQQGPSQSLGQTPIIKEISNSQASSSQNDLSSEAVSKIDGAKAENETPKDPVVEHEKKVQSAKSKREFQEKYFVMDKI